MIPIYPLTSENISQHRGKMVLACLHDGRTYVGRLTHCKDGHIILNGEEESTLHAANLKSSKKRPAATKKHGPVVNPKAQVKAFYPPYGYGYGFGYPGYGYGAGLALGLTTLALLFLI
ncbi:hypothetical protein ACTHPF_11615 [Paenibacillus sp. SAF-054]|uniref:hypothetical protein n=1 Tax=unclassified Paenibacillus TaxID=185978 RepID=UPI003F7FB42E